MARRKRDVNERAAQVVRIATGEETDPPPPNPLAVQLGSRGGRKGGPARAKKLSPARRREIARRAANARWHSPPKASNKRR